MYDRRTRWLEDIARFREHSVGATYFRHSYFEIKNYGCCEACAAYPPFVPILDDPPFPIPGCTNPEGCCCWLSLLFDWEYEGEPSGLLDWASERRASEVAEYQKAMKARDEKEAIYSAFYGAAEDMKSWYAQRDKQPDARDKAIAAAHRQVSLNQAFVRQRRKDYGEDLQLPRHYGFERLAIVAEQDGRYGEALVLCRRAKAEGWSGDWQKRIDRLTLKMKR